MTKDKLQENIIDRIQKELENHPTTYASDRKITQLLHDCVYALEQKNLALIKWNKFSITYSDLIGRSFRDKINREFTETSQSGRKAIDL